MQKEDCEKIAREIRIKYNPNNLSPFPYKNIEDGESELEILLFPFMGEKLKSILGAISFDKDNKKFSIFINQSQSDTGQHFALAHELGHYFLHKELVRDKLYLEDRDFLDGDRESIEIEANHFAYDLIMPAGLVQQVWDKLKNVQECAKVFNVSVSTMSIRLEKLNIIST